MSGESFFAAVSRWLFVFMIVFVGHFSMAQADPVDALLKKFDGAIEKLESSSAESMATAKAQYLADLAAAEKSAQQSGDLDVMLAIRKEVEMFNKSGTPGNDKTSALVSAKAIFSKTVAPIEADLAAKRAGLDAILRTKLRELQTTLTKAGNIEAAIKAKTKLESMATIEAPASGDAGKPTVPNAPATTAVVNKSPWSKLPPENEAAVDGGFFGEPITLPVGRHRLRKPIVIGSREPAKPSQVYIQEGTEISAAGTGRIFVMIGKGRAFGASFISTQLPAGLGGDWEFINCRFDRTTFYKGDTWRAKPHAATWTFENCFVENDFLLKSDTKNVGYNVKQTTFESIEFNDLTFHEPAGGVAQKPLLLMENCLFRKCKIPLSVLITTRNCGFEECSFVDNELAFPVGSELKVKIFTKDCSSRLRDIPSEVKLEEVPFSELSGPVGMANAAE